MKECVELLKKWDSGEFIKTVSMGGMGEAYEIAIQTLGMEIVRKLIDIKSDCSLWKNEEYFENVKKEVESVICRATK